MAKDFESTLRDALDLAAQSAHAAGSSAARIRGRKRTMHKRIVVSVTSFAAVVAISAAVVYATTASHGGRPRVTAVSPSATATQGPTASPPATSGPSRTAAPSQSATPGHSSSHQPVTADPHQVIDAAWLTPGQLPLAQVFGWKSMRADPTGSSPIGQQLTPTVFYVPNDTPFQALTTCANPAELLGRTSGAQHAGFTASTGASDQAGQFVFFFANSTSARQTFAWLQNQYGPSCLHATGATITRTAGDGVTSAAWLTLKGSSNAPDLPPYSREYFVLRGSTIGYVFVSSYRDGLPTAYDDVQQLSTIAAHLCVYGGSCS